MSGQFDFTRQEFEDLAQWTLKKATAMGASDSAVQLSESNGMQVSVRHQALETVEHNKDKDLSVTVYIGQQKGHASTSDFSEPAVERALQAAYDIAKFTASDPFSGLPEADYIYHGKGNMADLQLYWPWALGTEEAFELCRRTEQAAFDTTSLITNSDGASVGTHQGHFIQASSNGFMNGFSYSRHHLGVMPIASFGEEMERDAWYVSHRNQQMFSTPEDIGQYAAHRAASRLGAKKIDSRTCPVLFDAPLATGIIGSFAQAIQGGNLFRKSSFLLDALDTQVFPEHISIIDDPFIPLGMGSSYFDDEGLAACKRSLIDSGTLTGYLLSMYSARKLGLKPTGNASGSHNMSIVSTRTQQDDDFVSMLKKLGTGLLVTELLGQGVNYVTGDYSRGAAGFWVENGQIQYPVSEITIAGNLKEMYQQIVAVGADCYTQGSKTSGSILFEKMTIAG